MPLLILVAMLSLQASQAQPHCPPNTGLSGHWGPPGAVEHNTYPTLWSTVQGRVYAAAAAAKSLQSRPTLCDPIDGSPPGSPVPGILQARTLEWVAISFSNA